MTVTLTETGRSGNYVTVRVNWSVTTGSATSLGNASSNNRTLYIKSASSGNTLGSAVIKDEQYWYPSSTYSGNFSITFSVGTTNSGSTSVYIQTNNSGTQSCIWTNRDYCTNFSFSWSIYRSACTAATGLKFSANPFESSVQLQWTRGSNGTNNPITGQQIYYRILNGSTVVSTNTINVSKTASTYTLNTSDITRGYLLDFQIITIADYISDPVSARSSQARKNRIPNTPTSPTVSSTTVQPGDIIRVSFTNAGDPDNNLAGYEVSTNTSETIVGSRTGSTITYVDVSTSGWSAGTQVQFRVRGYDTLGVRGAWSTYTATVLVGSTLQINVGGAWKQSSEIKVNIGGVWKNVAEMKINVGGVWKTIT